MMAIAFVLDSRTKVDLSFWLYLIGMSSFWVTITFQPHASELEVLLYSLLNVFFVLLSALLNRSVFAAYGTLE
jgi:hypothetical protein